MLRSSCNSWLIINCHQLLRNIYKSGARVLADWHRGLECVRHDANHKLARKIADIGFYEFRRQLQYKAKLHGAQLVIATSRWFPSSKMCSVCGRIVEDLPLSVREWTCPCGAVHDREINGAINLRQYAVVRVSCTRINAWGEEASGAGLTARVKPASRKQELVMSRLGMD